jgi:hypothetical protein
MICEFMSTTVKDAELDYPVVLLEIPYFAHALFKSILSSGGKSTTMKPSVPVPFALAHNQTSPY